MMMGTYVRGGGEYHLCLLTIFAGMSIRLQVTGGVGVPYARVYGNKRAWAGPVTSVLRTVLLVGLTLLHMERSEVDF